MAFIYYSIPLSHVPDAAALINPDEKGDCYTLAHRIVDENTGKTWGYVAALKPEARREVADIVTWYRAWFTNRGGVYGFTDAATLQDVESALETWAVPMEEED